jgi:hypothetical protein
VSAQVVILDRVTSSVCLSEPEDDFLRAIDPCAGRPMNPQSGSSDECRKFLQRPPTARIRLRAGSAKVATGGKPRQARGRASGTRLYFRCNSSGLALLCVDHMEAPAALDGIIHAA